MPGPHKHLKVRALHSFYLFCFFPFETYINTIFILGWTSPVGCHPELGIKSCFWVNNSSFWAGGRVPGWATLQQSGAPNRWAMPHPIMTYRLCKTVRIVLYLYILWKWNNGKKEYHEIWLSYDSGSYFCSGCRRTLMYLLYSTADILRDREEGTAVSWDQRHIHRDRWLSTASFPAFWTNALK
jgi:hypothetical protein